MASNTYDIKIGGGFTPGFFQSISRGQNALNQLAATITTRLAAPLMAAFSGATFAQFIAGSANAADALADLREETGLAIETLGGIKLAADIKGLGEIDVPMKKFTAAVAEARIEGTKFNELFKTMGVDPMRELDQVLFDVADKFNGWADGVEKLGIAEEIFGTRQTKFIQLLNLGSEGLRENIREFGNTHVTVGAAASVVDEYNKELARMKSSLEGVAQVLVTGVGPAVVGVTNGLNSLVSAFHSNKILQGPLYQLFAQMGSKSASEAPAPTKPPAPQVNAPDPVKLLQNQVKLERETIDIEREKQRYLFENGLFAEQDFEKRKLLAEAFHTRELELLGEKRLAAEELNGLEAERLDIQDKFDHLGQLQKHKDFLARMEAEQEAHKQRMMRIYQEQGNSFSGIFGNMAQAIGTFVGEGSIAFKAFATAQAVASMAVGAIGAFAQASAAFPPPAGQIIGGIAAGAVVAAGAAQIAKINGAFYEGGFTGNIPTSDVAGIVHGQEFVIPADAVNKWGVGHFNQYLEKDIPATESSPGAFGASGGGATQVSTKIMVADTRQAIREFMASEGNKMVWQWGEQRGMTQRRG